MATLTHERLLSLFDYDRATGGLIWKERPREDFSTEHAWRTINRRQAGRTAGYKCPLSGYIHVGLDGRLYRAHRLVWFYVTGSWPDDQIDHISHNRSDNRFENLRPATDAENRRNQSRSSRNKSGVMGVYWYARRGWWQVYITAAGKRHNLGYFTDFDQAVAARKAEERRLGFHKNHGAAV